MSSRALVAIVPLAAASIVWLACGDEARSHVFSGRQFDPTRGCLLALASIDVVEGPEPETPCAPVCIASVADEAGPSKIYVSTMCPPYPILPYESDASSDPRCAPALVAYRFDTSCESDGAILNEPPDANANTDAGADAD